MAESDSNELFRPIVAKRSGIRPLPVHFAAALIDNAQRLSGAAYTHADFVKMVDGMQKYLAHPYQRALDPLPVIWKKGGVEVAHSRAGEVDFAAPSLLLIPSMINRSYIMDLMPGRSFARWLSAKGINVYVLDWGDAADDADMKTIDDVIGGRLAQALDAVTKDAGSPVHALGYCMGGTLLAGLASLQREKLKSLVFLASPWDFEAGDSMLTSYIRAGMPQAMRLIDHAGRLEVHWIQSLFAAVNADRAVQKFMDFADMDQDSAQAQLFVAVEDWLNDSVDLPGDVARHCLTNWYGENRTAALTWQVAGKIVDLSQMDIPALVIGSARDRLVPLESSLSLGKYLANKTVLEPEIGHIGMMTGRRAQALVWEAVQHWLKNHN